MKFNPLVSEQLKELSQVLSASQNEATISLIENMAQLIITRIKSGGKLLTAGNGGSAADALHMSEELVARYKADRIALPCIALPADTTALTCIGNDFGYDYVFSRSLEALGKEGDVFVFFSTSGNSSNITKAIDIAQQKKLNVIGFLGKSGGACKGRSDIEWIVPSETTARIQEMHGWAIHAILECIEQEFLNAKSL